MNINDYKYITNEIFPHGGGTRVTLLTNAIIFSILEKKEFILTPFAYQTEKKEFNANPITKTLDYPSYCNRWDSILNLELKKIYEIPKEELKYVLPLCHPSVDNIPPSGSYFNDKIRELRYEIKNKFFKIPEKEITDKIIVSVHIRRGDATPWAHRFLPNEYYVNTINVLKDFLIKNDIDYDLKIYTERNGFNNKGLEEFNIYFDDEILDIDVWNKLINSDIIIGSNSALSSSAAMFSDGLYIHSYKENQPLVSDWIYSSELNYNLLKKRFNEIKRNRS
jgi:hypothetical protein